MFESYDEKTLGVRILPPLGLDRVKAWQLILLKVLIVFVVLCSKDKRLDNLIRCANKSELYSTILNHMNAMKNMPIRHSCQNVIGNNVTGSKFDSVQCS